MTEKKKGMSVGVIIAIVVAGLFLLAIAILCASGGLGYFLARPALSRAQLASTQAQAQTIQAAARLHVMEHPNGCPTAEQLLEDGELSRGTNLRDGWAHPFRITCANDNISVVSPGPDGQLDTADDITAH